MQKVRRDEAQLACIEELLKLGDCFVYEEFPYQKLRYGRRAMEETERTRIPLTQTEYEKGKIK